MKSTPGFSSFPSTHFHVFSLFWYTIRKVVNHTVASCVIFNLRQGLLLPFLGMILSDKHLDLGQQFGKGLLGLTFVLPSQPSFRQNFLFLYEISGANFFVKTIKKLRSRKYIIAPELPTPGQKNVDLNCSKPRTICS